MPSSSLPLKQSVKEYNLLSNKPFLETLWLLKGFRLKCQGLMCEKKNLERGITAIRKFTDRETRVKADYLRSLETRPAVCITSLY